MTTPAQKTEPADPTPAANPFASTYKPPPDAIRVGSMTFVTRALPIAGVNSINDHITARRADSVAGVDIYYLPSLQHFRAQRFGPDIKDARPKLIPVSRVEFWEQW